MDNEHSGRDRGNEEPRKRRSISVLPASGMTLFLIAMALLFAIGFFYATKASRSDRRAEAVTEAAASVDNAGSSIERVSEKVAGKHRQDR